MIINILEKFLCESNHIKKNENRLIFYYQNQRIIQMKLFFIVLITLNIFANDKLELIDLAYKNGLEPVPTTFDTLLLKLKIDSTTLTKEKILLGKKLFFEKDLSLNKDISCASCHSFNKGGADGISTAIGHKKRKNPFHLNTPTVLNTAFSNNYFWNGRSKALEDQAKGPLQAPFEMSITPKLAEERIQKKEEYRKLFKRIYKEDNITFENIVNAIASYEKILITKGRFDDFLLGDFNALNKEEKEGLTLFISKSCVGCHNGMGLGGQTLRKFPLTFHKVWSLSNLTEIKNLEKKYLNQMIVLKNSKFYNNTKRIEYLNSKLSEKEMNLLKEGFFNQIDKEKRIDVIANQSCTFCHVNNSNKIKSNIEKTVSFPFENKGGFLGSEDPKKYFRVPLLRNVIKTKPYFHNGSVEKLENAIQLMGIHQSRNMLSNDEIDKIVSFLKSVDGEIINYTIE
jgi:cytochrome c peroxidase